MGKREKKSGEYIKKGREREREREREECGSAKNVMKISMMLPRQKSLRQVRPVNRKEAKERGKRGVWKKVRKR